ncbi:MAG: hypothetical protein ACOYM3_28760 [Terrimicrobiaceae bacterium]
MSTKTKIQAYERRNYGQQAIYAIGEAGKAIATLTGRKTINAGDIKALRTLGFDFEMIPDPQGAFNLIGGAA